MSEKTYLQDYVPIEKSILEGLASLDSENKQFMLPVLLMSQASIIKNIGGVIRGAKEAGLGLLELNAICIASMTGGVVDESIREYFPQEWFNEDGRVTQEYKMIFSPKSDLDMYQTIIGIFKTEE